MNSSIYEQQRVHEKRKSRSSSSTGRMSIAIAMKSIQESLALMVQSPSHEEEDEQTITSDTSGRSSLTPVEEETVDRQRNSIRREWQKRLSIQTEDLEAIVDEDQNFRDLQRTLRRKGCITNLYAQQTMHNYIYNFKNKAARHEKNRKHEAAMSA